MALLPSITTSTLSVAGVVAGEGREGGPGGARPPCWVPPPPQGTLSLESDGDVHSSTASWSGVPEAAVARASHFCRPSFFFFLKKQQHLVSETTSTSTGRAMGVLEWPVVGSSLARSPLVELTTCTDP